MLENRKNIIGLMVEVMAYSSASVFGPLVIFLGIGYFLDKHFQTKPIFLLIGLAVAFIITNVLLFRKSRSVSFEVLKEKKENKKEN